MAWGRIEYSAAHEFRSINRAPGGDVGAEGCESGYLLMETGLLYGKEEIRRYLNDASDYKLRLFISAGMPVRIDGNVWIAHAQNLEEFFVKYTRVDSRGLYEGGVKE